jgi:hypothetical protein
MVTIKILKSGNREGAEEDACSTPQNPNGESLRLLYTGYFPSRLPWRPLKVKFAIK